MTPKNIELTDSIAEAVSRINAEFWDADDLEMLTGTKSSTWRYLSHIGWRPTSFRHGKRRLWRRSVVAAWLAEQERAGAEQQRERTALAADDEPAAERLLTRTGPAQPRAPSKPRSARPKPQRERRQMLIRATRRCVAASATPGMPRTPRPTRHPRRSRPGSDVAPGSPDRP